MEINNKYTKFILLLIFIPVYFVSMIQYSNRIILLLLFLIFMLFIPVVTRNSKVQLTSIHWLWLLTFVVVIFNMIRTQTDDFYLLFYATMIVMLFLIPSDDTAWMEFGYKIIFIMGIFFAFFTIVSVVFPEYYSNHLAPLLLSNSTFDPIRYLKFGIYSGLTYQTAIDATYLSLGVGAAFVLFINRSEKKVGILLLIGIEILCIFFTAKRAHILFSALAILFVAYLITDRGKRFSTIIKVIGALFIVLLLTYYFVPAANYIFTRFLEGSDDISNGRYTLYQSAWSFFNDKPILGIGWEQFRYAYSSKYTDVHNIYLQLLCETGIVGTVIFVTAFITTLIMSIKKLCFLRVKGDKSKSKYIELSCFIQIFTLLYGLTGNCLYDYYVIFFYFFAVLIAIKLPIQDYYE